MDFVEEFQEEWIDLLDTFTKHLISETSTCLSYYSLPPLSKNKLKAIQMSSFVFTYQLFHKILCSIVGKDSNEYMYVIEPKIIAKYIVDTEVPYDMFIKILNDNQILWSTIFSFDGKDGMAYQFSLRYNLMVFEKGEPLMAKAIYDLALLHCETANNSIVVICHKNNIYKKFELD